MNYNVRISDNFLRGDHVDGEVLQHTDLNELENVAKTAINANYEDIQKLQDGTISVSNSEKLDGATLSKFSDETLQNSDAKVPTSSQVKQYVDGAISSIDLDGYYTKREIDETLEDYPTFTDYATPSKAGVIKSGYNGLQVNSTNGKVYCDTYTYANYGNVENQRFISKGTLENVITGKDLTTKSYVDGELANKVDKVTGKGLSTNDYTNDEKSKLSGIEAGAQANKIETIKVNGTNQEISSKSVNIPVPTKTSDLTNDSGFITNTVNDLSNYYTKSQTYNKTEINNLIPQDLTDYVKNTDYATSSKGGVIKTNAGSFAVSMNNGELKGITKDYANAYPYMSTDGFITKGTLENVITGKGLTTKSYVDGLVGDINTAIDSINGEVI